MLNIFLKFSKLSRSFLIFLCPLWREVSLISLEFMLKAYSTQDLRGIRILSIDVIRLVKEIGAWAEYKNTDPYSRRSLPFSAFLPLPLPLPSLYLPRRLVLV